MSDPIKTGETKRIIGFIVFFVIIGIGSGLAASALKFSLSQISVIGFLAITIILLAFAAVVLWKIINDEIPLAGLVSEPKDIKDCHDHPKASLSRFQFLIFTFVVAGLFLMLSIETGGFVNIPTNVLGLIGISGGSYIISKAVGGDAAERAAKEREAAEAAKTDEEAAKKKDGGS